MSTEPSNFAAFFTPEFLALLQFSSPYRAYPDPNNPNKLIKRPAHSAYNDPPFGAFNPNKPALHLTNTNIFVADLDNCYRPNGQLKNWARDFVNKWVFKTTHENSVSGRGLHLFIEAYGIEPVECTGKYKVEGDPSDELTGGVDYFYGQRWIALNARSLFSPHPVMLKVTPLELEEFKRELISLRPLLKKDNQDRSILKAEESPRAVAPNVTQLADRIQTRDLPRGTEAEITCANRAFAQSLGFDHRHKLDLEYAIFLVRDAGLGEKARLGRFEKYKLHNDRDKQYTAITFEKAVAFVKEKKRPTRRLFLEMGTLSTVTAKSVKWVKRHVLRQAALNLFIGDPDIGKSLLMILFIAELSRAGLHIVIICREDDYGEMWVPRFIAAEADLTMIHPLFHVGVEGSEEKIDWMLDNAEHYELLQAALIERKAAACLIDPLHDFSGKLNLNDGGDVRRITNALMKVAREADAAVVLNCHTTKALIDSVIKMAAGSLQLMAGVPVSWVCINDPEHKGQRLMLQGRNKSGKKRGFEYKVISAPWPPDCPREPIPEGEEDDGIGLAKILRETDRDANDLLSERMEKGGTKTARARGWIKELLANGPVRSPACWRESENRGFDKDTVNRACSSLGVIRDKDTWRLPPQPKPPPTEKPRSFEYRDNKETNDEDTPWEDGRE